MPRPSLKTAPLLLRDAWRYFRKHTAFLSILFWFLILPDTLQDWIVRARFLPSSPLLALQRGIQLSELFWMFLSLLLAFVGLWGWGCVLFVGKRMIQGKAGRARSSFRGVRRDALPLLLPLLGTTILQGCFVFYRSLLYLVPALAVIVLSIGAPSGGWNILALAALSPLLLPAILYSFRTFFCDIALASENVAYRAALRRSGELVRGRFLRTTARVLLLAVLTVLPASLLWRGLDATALFLDPRLGYVSDIFGETAASVASVLFTLGCIALYGQLRDSFTPTILVHRKEQ